MSDEDGKCRGSEFVSKREKEDKEDKLEDEDEEEGPAGWILFRLAQGAAH